MPDYTCDLSIDYNNGTKVDKIVKNIFCYSYRTEDDQETECSIRTLHSYKSPLCNVDNHLETPV